MSVTVVGGGIIGLSIAWRLMRDGADVTVLDGGIDPAGSGDQGGGKSSAWWVAAGMLAPGGEARFEPPALIRLMRRSAELWPSFVEDVGVDVGYDTAGTLHLALTADDRAEAMQTRAGFEEPRPSELRPSEPRPSELRPSELRDLEPALTPRIRFGVRDPGDRQVDPRRVVAALRARLGGRVVPRVVANLSDVDGDTVVVAAGCGTAALTGLPIRAVKGQVLRLRAEPGLLRHVLTAVVDGRHVYLVPRADGEIVVGATQEERPDRLVTAEGVHELLHAALALVPALADAELTAVTVGHRPATPDNAPLLGEWGRPDPRVIVAAGHHRNGVLLAPVTADLIAALIRGEHDPMLDDFAPGRFR